MTIFSPIFEPSIGRSISPYNLAFLRANLAMRKSQIFHQKINKVGVRELAPLPSRSPLFATNVMARPAPLVARSTATGHSRAESPERPTRASRDRWVPTLSRENRWEEIGNFSANLSGQMTVRDSRNLICVRIFLGVARFRICIGSGRRAVSRLLKL